MYEVVVVGAGWAGCAAALQAAKEGARVILLERTDMILGTGLVGGIMRNNGRYTAAEEMIAMGGGELFLLTDEMARHKNIDFPGHRHASLYDIKNVVKGVEDKLALFGVEVRYQHRIIKLEINEESIIKVMTTDSEVIEGVSFIDATGTAGPMKNCIAYGNGCAMCVIRCPSFGGRMSLTELSGIKEIHTMNKEGGIGGMSGSCKLLKEFLAQDIIDQLNKKGVVVISIPPEIRYKINLNKKICQQYSLGEYIENLVILDTGYAKLMTSYFPLAQLRMIPGLERARYEDPYGGSIGNSIRFTAMSPRDDSMMVRGLDNLFCAGEKAGPLVGHTEAICTGVLAGHNAVRKVKGQPLLKIPTSTAIGDAIEYTGEQMRTNSSIIHKNTFSGSIYFERMKQKGLYSLDKQEITERVSKAGCLDVFDIEKGN